MVPWTLETRCLRLERDHLRAIVRAILQQHATVEPLLRFGDPKQKSHSAYLIHKYSNLPPVNCPDLSWV